MIRIPKTRSKYHAEKTVMDGITFASHKEAKYYGYLKTLMRLGEVIGIECQPVFPLQEKFIKNGVKYQAITYVADFRAKYSDGHEEIVEIKGFETQTWKIKQKLFEYKYPDLTLKVIGGKQK